MIDQLRAIDKGRFRAVLGELSEEEMRRVDEGMAAFLGFTHHS